MTTFYRYVRPCRFDEARMEYQTLPKGGVCLRFEEHDGRYLFFTHARCHPDDLFSKEVARHIANQRADVVKSDARLLAIHGGLPLTKDTDLLLSLVENRCRQFNPHAHTILVARYMQTEWLGLAATLEDLRRSRAFEVEKAALWEEAIRAMRTVKAYEDAGR